MRTINFNIIPNWFTDACNWTWDRVHQFVHFLDALFASFSSLLTDHWAWLDTIVYTSEFQKFTEITLGTVLIASIITMFVMLYYRIRTPLDSGYFVRELGITTLLSAIYLRLFLGTHLSFRYLTLTYTAGYIILLISSFLILITLIYEHQLSNQEVDAMIEDKYA